MIRTLLSVVLAGILGGCALSRDAQVERHADKVASQLKSEQSKALASSAADKTSRLDYLTSLHTQLSLANVARGAVPYAIPEEDHELAWDVLDEVYSTLEWNIPLLPSQAKPMPAAFAGGTLNLNATPAKGGAGQPTGYAK